MTKARSRTIFSCQKCGAQRPRWEGRCNDCGAWNSLVEEVLVDHEFHPWESPPGGSKAGRSGEALEPLGPLEPLEPSEPLNALATRGGLGGLGGESNQTAAAYKKNKVSGGALSLAEPPRNDDLVRRKTQFSELDRVLGGGLVRGSYVLLGGDPGIGKSTLLLQMSGGLAEQNATVLYISAEESVSQTHLRAQRLNIRSARVFVASESNLERIKSLIQKYQPDVLIVDSIQTIYVPSLPSAPGSVSQVRDCAGHLMNIAKSKNLSIFLIGHVTKDGNIAGPKVLEHMVDTVLSFEGDVNYQFRLLRVNKNRFGPTHELGVFRMSGLGLEQVTNPSELFLENHSARPIGSAVFSCVEGTRPLLCEVQALTSSTPMPLPRRTSVGVDVNRVHLLAAVLDKHANVSFSHSDIFVNVVGGLKIVEPAADLAVAAALISSACKIEVESKICFFGEIGLTGEVRAVPFADIRLAEAEKLGFQKFVIPSCLKKSLKDLPKTMAPKISWVAHVNQLKQILGPHTKLN